MTRVAVREPRRAVRVDTASRRREFGDVRHPLHPDLHVERVIVCPSGIHVVTTVPASRSGDGRAGHPAGAPAGHASDAAAALVPAGRAAADVIAALLPVRYRARVRPVLCRTDHEAMADLVDGVLVTTPTTLEHIVRSSPVVLSTSEINDVAHRLDARLEPFPIGPVRRRRRWTRRRGLLAAAAATACAGTAVALGELGALTLPW